MSTVSLSPSNARASEGSNGNSFATFTVTLSEAAGEQVTVGYSTASSSAQAGEDFVSTSGTVVFAPGLTQQTFNVEIVGDTDYEPDEIFRVTLSNPQGAALDQSGSVIKGFEALYTIQNDDLVGLPIVSLSPSNARASEGSNGNSFATFTVTLSEAAGEQVTVGYSTASSSAQAGEDFVSTSGTVVFAPGLTQQTFNVEIVGDTDYEPDEIFRVTLSNPQGAALDQSGSVIKGFEALYTIQNDDLVGLPIVSLSPSNARASEGSNGNSFATFTVTLSEAAGEQVTVGYSTASSSAQAGEDFVSTSGTVVFAPGLTQQTFNVEIVGDTDYEPDEIFRVTLSNPQGAALDQSGSVIKGFEALYTIQNDDLVGLPIVSLSPSNARASEGSNGNSFATFTVTLSEAAGEQVTVGYSTASSSAQAGEDFVSTSGTVVFAPGLTQQTFNVEIVGDTDYEPDEIFRVTLSNPQGAALDQSGSVIKGFEALYTIQNDDLVRPNENYKGTANDDALVSNLGDDLIDGMGGIDTLVLNGDQSHYTLTLSADNITLTDRMAGGSGTDTLVSIENLRFSDGSFDLSIRSGVVGLSTEGIAAIVELYIAYFDRAPAASGLGYWATRLADGMTLPEIANSFFVQPETQRSLSGVPERGWQPKQH